MYHFLRTLYTCVLLIFLTDTFGQVIIDTELHKQYIQAFSKLPKRLRQSAREIQKDTSYKDGFGILTELKIDTLNKEEQKLLGITITSIGPERKKNKKYKPDNSIAEKKSGDELLFCSGQYNYDTLFVNISVSFDETIVQKTFHSQIETKFIEIHGTDSIFWSGRLPDKTNRLTVSANTTKLVLNDTNFSSNKALYGYCEIETESYNTSDILFKKGYIKKRLLFKYYFKFKPTKKIT